MSVVLPAEYLFNPFSLLHSVAKLSVTVALPAECLFNLFSLLHCCEISWQLGPELFGSQRTGLFTSSGFARAHFEYALLLVQVLLVNEYADDDAPQAQQGETDALWLADAGSQWSLSPPIL